MTAVPYGRRPGGPALPPGFPKEIVARKGGYLFRRRLREFRKNRSGSGGKNAFPGEGVLYFVYRTNEENREGASERRRIT